MMPLIEIMSAALGVTSSILGVVSFCRDRIRHRTWFIAGAFVIGSLATYLAWQLNAERTVAEISAYRSQALKKDAETVSDAINLTGWEEVGDCVGYLAQAAGFYARHAELFPTEREAYARQLNEWQDFVKEARTRRRLLYGSDWSDLRGLVQAADNQISSIASGQSEN